MTGNRTASDVPAVLLPRSPEELKQEAELLSAEEIRAAKARARKERAVAQASPVAVPSTLRILYR